MHFLPEQQKWVTKLFGYDYEIIYKNGKDNVVVDECVWYEMNLSGRILYGK
jgi:hypothetical protein